MPRFAVGQSITTREPTIEVEAGLAVGNHRFALVVVGASGRRSARDTIMVRVQRLVIPTPTDVLDPGRLDPGRLGGLVRPPGGGTPRGPAPPNRNGGDPA